MAEVDARIPLGVIPPQFMNPAQIQQLKTMQYQQQLQQLQLQEAGNESQSKNALAQLMNKPGAIGPDGQPTAEAISSLPPAVQYSVRNHLADMFKQKVETDRAVATGKLSDEKAKSEAQDRYQTRLRPIGETALSTYEDTLAKGGTVDEATRAGQQALNEGLDVLDKEGDLPKPVLDQARGVKFNPYLFRARLSQGKQKTGATAEVEEAKRAVAEGKITPEEGQALIKRATQGTQQPALVKVLEAAGIKPGTPEYENAMREYADRLKAPTAAMVGTGNADLSKQYSEDPEYRGKVDYWAEVMARGESLPPRFAQSGAGKKMFQDIINRVPQVSAGAGEMIANRVGMVGEKAESRSLGTRSANIEQAASEAREMMPIVQETSDAFSRTDFVPANKAIAAWAANTGDPKVREFGAALNSFINAYGRAVNPSGTATVSDKEHAREMLSTADSKEQVRAILKVLDKEMTAAQKSPQTVKDAQRKRLTEQGGFPKVDAGTQANRDNSAAELVAQQYLKTPQEMKIIDSSIKELEEGLKGANADQKAFIQTQLNGAKRAKEIAAGNKSPVTPGPATLKSILDKYK